MLKKFFRNRAVLGGLGILMSLVLCFVVAPLINTAASATTQLVRVAKDIPAGVKIAADMLEATEVGSYNLPGNIIASVDEAVGKYSLLDMKQGDYILSTKIGENIQSAYLSDLTDERLAMSVTIKSFAAGLSGKLVNGDIVTLIAGNYGEAKQTQAPPELQFVKVLAATTGKGTDNNGTAVKADANAKEEEMPATLTLLVTPAQAKKLVDMENNGLLHAALVYRGDTDVANTFLAKQDVYLQSPAADAPIAPKEGDTNG